MNTTATPVDDPIWGSNVVALPKAPAATSWSGALQAALNSVEEARKRRGPAGISTGFPSIDDVIGGLERGTYHVLGGRPGMGKSALAAQWALNVARAGRPVVEFALEMSAPQLAKRVLSAAAHVPLRAMLRGSVSPFETDALVRAEIELARLPISIVDAGGLTVAQIAESAAIQRAQKGEIALIVVDHLSIIRPDQADMRGGPTWATGQISHALKALAKEMDCPVVAVAQLNRAVEGREDKRPSLMDLRYSGDIEQDADTVSFLYREEYYLRKPPMKGTDEKDEKFQRRRDEWEDRRERARGRAELLVEKNRDGEPGTASLRFHGETASFSEIT